MTVQMSANPLVSAIGKPATEFTRQDIIGYIDAHGIRMVNFRYVGADGKLKTLNFVLTGRDYLESIFTTGERVDGSSLFPYVHADSSDLYVIPRFRTAFLNPFEAEPTLELLCSFYTRDGEPLESSPEYILRKAATRFTVETGLRFKAMGELEYYVFSEHEDRYAPEIQRGYHASQPFTNHEAIRTEAMRLIAQCGGLVKYGHSEVGSFTDGDIHYEQHEIEFRPTDPVPAMEQLIVAKWILRMLGQRHGVTISFAPKITPGHAGSGLHIHFLAEHDGRNVMADADGITDAARSMIAGMLGRAQSLTAFGNTVPTSYLRLVPNHEAPVKVCWGESNRQALVRVPLAWNARTNMISHANPAEAGKPPQLRGRQTAEFRVPDGSADLYHLLAGMILAALEGLKSPAALDRAKDLRVDVDLFAPENQALLDRLEALPTSCAASAEFLLSQRAFYEQAGIFPPGTIDAAARRLWTYGDACLRDELKLDPESLHRLVHQYFHCR